MVSEGLEGDVSKVVMTSAETKGEGKNPAGYLLLLKASLGRLSRSRGEEETRQFLLVNSLASPEGEVDFETLIPLVDLLINEAFTSTSEHERNSLGRKAMAIREYYRLDQPDEKHLTFEQLGAILPRMDGFAFTGEAGVDRTRASQILNDAQRKLGHRLKNWQREHSSGN